MDRRKLLGYTMLFVLTSVVVLDLYPAPVSAQSEGPPYPSEWKAMKPNVDWPYEMGIGNTAEGTRGIADLGCHIVKYSERPQEQLLDDIIGLYIDVGAGLKDQYWDSDPYSSFVRRVRIDITKTYNPGAMALEFSDYAAKNLNLASTTRDYTDAALFVVGVVIAIAGAWPTAGTSFTCFMAALGIAADFAPLLRTAQPATIQPADRNAMSAYIVFDTTSGASDNVNAFVGVDWKINNAPVEIQVKTTVTFANWVDVLYNTGHRWEIRETETVSTSVTLRLESGPADVYLDDRNPSASRIDWLVQANCSKPNIVEPTCRVDLDGAPLITSRTWDGKPISVDLAACKLRPGTHVVTCTVSVKEVTPGGWSVHTAIDSVTVTVPTGITLWSARTSPSGHYYNLREITFDIATPGVHIDTGGSYDYGYQFFVYARVDSSPIGDFIVGADGKIRVTGWFRQDDILTPDLQPGRRESWIWVMYANDIGTIVKGVKVLNHADGNIWTYKDMTIDGLIPLAPVKVAFGRYDIWANDWQLVAECAAVSVTVVLEDTFPPTVSQPLDITYAQGTTGHSITWSVSDASPTSYTIQCGTILQSGERTANSYSLTQNVDGLSEGTYTYTCMVTDSHGYSSSDQVKVIVKPPDYDPPAISSPADITYYDNSYIGREWIAPEYWHTIVWQPSDLNPTTYEVRRTTAGGTSVLRSGTWSNGVEIVEDVDSLPIGTYAYTCTVYDLGGNSRSDSVSVTVLPDTTTPAIISHPENITYEEPELSGHSFAWSAVDANPAAYRIEYALTSWDYWAFSQNGVWRSGTPITQTLDFLGGRTLGTYMLRLTVYDGAGNYVEDIVNVTIVPHTAKPVFTTIPADLTFKQTFPWQPVKRYNVTWSAYDTYPGTYEIKLVKGPGYSGAPYTVKSGTWSNGGAITLELASNVFFSGTYVYVCTVYDAYGNSESDSVTVTVTPASLY